MKNSVADNIQLPLDNEQGTRLQDAVSGLSTTQLHWVSGYVADLADNTPSNLISIGDSHTTRSLTEVASLE